MGRNANNLNNLTILFWNANGLNNKINEFRDFAENSDIDIILIQEAKLNPEHRCNISNYSLYRKDRPRVPRRQAQGGIAIYVKRNLNHYEINDLATDNLESNSIMVLSNNNQKILISSIYVRHGRAFPIND
jgi:exonuclease III